MSNNSNTLQHHLTEVKQGSRCFENAFQGVSRMILESTIEKVVVNGKVYSGIPHETCVTCHNRGKRIGVSFRTTPQKMDSC